MTEHDRNDSPHATEEASPVRPLTKRERIIRWVWLLGLLALMILVFKYGLPFLFNFKNSLNSAPVPTDMWETMIGLWC